MPHPHVPCQETFSKFTSNLQPGQIALGLFDSLPDIMFWIKDTQRRYVFVNRAFSDVLGSKPEQMIGRSDSEYFAPELARVFSSDDDSVLQTGETIPNKMELMTRRAGGIEWRMTTKIPLRDLQGEIVGTAGISRRLNQREGHPLPAPYRAISRLVDYVHDNVDNPISVEELAEKTSMSVSTLERRFRSHLGTSPKRFIVHAKIAAACDRLLNTPMGISQIAESIGYHEHASFTRTFTKVMHMSPTAYRRHYRLLT
jgi:PAS domain S-box-containing protein